MGCYFKKNCSCLNVGCCRVKSKKIPLLSIYLFSWSCELNSFICFKLLWLILFFWLGFLMTWVMSNLTTLLFCYMLYFTCIIAGLKMTSFPQILVIYICAYLFSNLVKKCWYFLYQFSSSITYLVYFNFVSL